MNKVYIFDVDGTLTPSRRRMTEDFARFFDEWSKSNTFYLVSGSDLDKIKEQIPMAYLDRAEGVFTCGGNKFYIGNKLEYEKTFKPPETLLTYLGELIRFSETPVQSTNHRENRGYFEWDNEVGEREQIAEYVKRTWTNLDAVIGGQISIDIAPIGNDKSQVIKRVKNDNPNCEYIFIGDRTMEGGNDYPLAKVMKEMENCEAYQAGEPSQEDGYKKTEEILKKIG